jgi:predicted nucleic acid-binding Zn finger protein
MQVFTIMSNACFSDENNVGRNCKDAIRGRFQIPSGGRWVDIGIGKQYFKVVYFKYGAAMAYKVGYDHTSEDVIWQCSCPDFTFNDRTTHKTCCKHIQAVIDKQRGIVRSGGNYEEFLVKHIQ